MKILNYWRITVNDCEYMTVIGCPARDAAKSLILQEITESLCTGKIYKFNK